MTLNSRSAVIEALASGKPEALLGAPETSWLDFKTAPYGPSDNGKFELCKDVAAFANTQDLADAWRGDEDLVWVGSAVKVIDAFIEPSDLLAWL